MFNIVSWAKVWLYQFSSVCIATIWISFRKSRGQRLIFGFGVLNLDLATSPMLEDDLACFEINLSTTWNFFLSNRILYRGNRSSMILIYVKGALPFLLFSLLFPILPFQENCQKTPINARKQTFPRFWDGQTFVEWGRCREPTNTFAKLPIKSTHWFSGRPSIQK